MLDDGLTSSQRQHMKWLDHENLVRSSVQLASDGRWEDAVPIESTDRHALHRWLAESGPNVAIESVYCDASGDLQGFFGFRRIFEDTEERTSFWEGVVQATEAYQSVAPRQQLVAWLGLLRVPSMLEASPSGTQLGVFNQWQSAGPVTLRGTRLNEADIASGPDWLRSGATAPICREHYWMTPQRVWVAETLTVLGGGRYWVDPSALPV
ncbi:MAG: hypothetical protein K0B16_18450 [Burkholderiaceae bacterium]|nr:hypothetical protein [Burkholderiaceae bacterium]